MAPFSWYQRRFTFYALNMDDMEKVKKALFMVTKLENFLSVTDADTKKLESLSLTRYFRVSLLFASKAGA
jgi:hypothetical protein